jgi:glyoxylase-like metal-dependent hydrolase (beta-lactamase superfamily II)
VVYDRLARFEIGENETFSAGLERVGYQAGDVGTAVVSHLHQDHIGGIGEMRQAELLVAADEWRSLRRPLAEARGLLRSHIDLPGLRWSPVEFEPLPARAGAALQPFSSGRDLFGDGSLILLPTPGHTPGSMSLLVHRDDGPPLLLVGDLTYDIHAFERGVHSGVGRRRRLARTRQAVLELRAANPGLRILAAHDPAAADLLDAS